MGRKGEYENCTISEILGGTMGNRLRLLLLNYIESEGNIANLEKSGYSYATIAKEYSRLINEKMLVVNEQLNFELSDKGYMELERLVSEMKKLGRVEIEPFNKYKTEKIDKYEIYIE